MSDTTPQKRYRSERLYIKRSKNGCRQCRERKVKCDEFFPSCNRCYKKGERCGYLDLPERESALMKLTEWKEDEEDPIDLDRSFEFMVVTPPEEKEDNIPINIPLITHSSPFKHFRCHTYNDFTTDSLINQYEHLIMNKSTLMKPTFFSISLFESSINIDLRIFDASLLIAYGLSLSTHNDLLSKFIKVQNRCMNHAVESLNVFNDSNALMSLTLSMALDISSKYLTSQNIGYDQSGKFLNGLLSIINTVYQDPIKFPDSYSILKEFILDE